MSVLVGSLSVDLVCRLLLEKKNLGKAAQGARGAFDDIKKSARGMGDGISGATHEGRAAIALLGEEVGIRVPRHLRHFILELPGVGTALNAAFSSVAVVALIGLVVQAGEKLHKYWESLSKLSSEEKKL